MTPSRILKLLLACLAFGSFALAAIPDVMSRGHASIPKVPASKRPVYDRNGTLLPPLSTVYYFDQLIDHDDPGKGTFRQRYWTTWEFYEAGGPIILMTPGEASAESTQASLGYLTTATINGRIAQQESGATILLEHRFFGLSNPYGNLTTQSLELLTIQQAIDDLVYFAQHVDLPMPGGDQVKPHQAPWVLIGGSYPGALTGWTMVNKPGVFWAGYSSSGVVEAINDFYDYFKPIREYMPQNCSADVEAVIAYLDAAYAQNFTPALDYLKSAFGLTGLSYVDDFAAALRINLYAWQDYQPTNQDTAFSRFCDALEVDNGVSANASGWGLTHAINAWGTFWKINNYGPMCGNFSANDCLGTHNPSLPWYHYTTVNDWYRSWLWMLCNQLGFSMVGPPEGQPAIVSRIVQPTYAQRACVNYFPEVFSAPRPPTTEETNAEYRGWNLTVDRLFSANGLRDPWLEATISADGVNKPSNVNFQPVYETDAFHCSDLITAYGDFDATVANTQLAGLSSMRTWLSQWKAPTL